MTTGYNLQTLKSGRKIVKSMAGTLNISMDIHSETAYFDRFPGNEPKIIRYMKPLNTVLIVVLTLNFGCDWTIAAPMLEIVNPEIDFGISPLNSTLSARYWLKSTGSSPVEIEWVDPGCPCATINLAQKILEPGDSVAFDLLFKTGRIPTEYDQRPFVKSNASDNPMRLILKSRVMRDAKDAYPVGVNPYRALFTIVKSSRRDTAIVILKNNSGSPVEISLAHSRADIFLVELPERIESGSSAKVRVILNSEGGSISFEHSFTIACKWNDGQSEKLARLSVPVLRY